MVLRGAPFNGSIPCLDKADSVDTIGQLLAQDWIKIAVYEHQRSFLYPNRGASDPLHCEKFVGFLHPIEFLGPIQFGIIFDSEFTVSNDNVGELRVYGYSDPGKISVDLFLPNSIRLDFESAFFDSIRSGMNNFQLGVRLNGPLECGDVNEEYLREHGYPESDISIKAVQFESAHSHQHIPAWFSSLVRN